jgi:hypothetical protein
MSRRTANQRSKTGDQLFGLKRLGQIVVGPRIEAGNLVRPAVTRRQHQHWHLARFLAPAVENGQPIDFRQAEIEDDRIIAFGRAEIVAILAIGGEIDGIASAFQRRAQLPAKIGFVFDDQDAHQIPLEVRSPVQHARS